MDIQRFKQRLLELDRDLSARTQRETARGRAQSTDAKGDFGDASFADEAASLEFTEAELDSKMVSQVRDALRRIEAGTFGQCIVDGEPIEPKRLEASPWTPYCLKHQEQAEAAAPPRSKTL